MTDEKTFDEMNEEERREYNLDNLAKVSQKVADELRGYQVQTVLKIDENGVPDMYLGDVAFFDNKYEEIVEEQFNKFSEYTNQIRINTILPKAFDEEAGNCLEKVLKYAAEEEIKFESVPGDGKAYFVVCFGVAFGGYLKRLLEKTEAACLILVEPNYELLFHSLSVCDWGEIVDMATENEINVHFFISQDVDAISRNIQSAVRIENFAEVDGLLMFRHYQNPILKQAANDFYKNVRELLQGLGFFYDETIMLTNNYYNLVGGQTRLYKRPRGEKFNVPVFVVGSGPSVDNDLEFIKENQDKAIIVSCGSGIRPLLNSGIYPDFHVELENIEVNPIIAQAAEDHDLSQICLVTSSTTDMTVTKYFGEVICFFRNALSPYPIFSQETDNCLKNATPTVVNTGVAFVQEVGFRKVYLFGADMGKRDQGDGLHHSKHAYHYTKGAKYLDQEYDIEVPGNLGGISFTSKGLNWARLSLEKAFRDFSSGYTYYNCSDGARLNYSIPMISKAIKLSEIPQGKKQQIENIIELFDFYTQEMLDKAWNDEKMNKACNFFLDEVGNFIQNEITDFRDGRYYRQLMKSYLNPANPEVFKDFDLSMNQWMGIALIYRGTIFMSLIGAHYYLHRLPDEEQQMSLQKVVKDSLLEMLEDFREKTQDRLSHMAEDTKNDRGRPWIKDFFAELEKTDKSRVGKS